MKAHLTPSVLPGGPGATKLRALCEGLLRLIEAGVDDQRLWAVEVKVLIAERAGIGIYCCTKTLSVALRALAKYTPLIARDGRRWRLRFGELRDEGSELLRVVNQAARREVSARQIKYAPSGG